MGVCLQDAARELGEGSFVFVQGMGVEDNHVQDVFDAPIVG